MTLLRIIWIFLCGWDSARPAYPNSPGGLAGRQAGRQACWLVVGWVASWPVGGLAELPSGPAGPAHASFSLIRSLKDCEYIRTSGPPRIQQDKSTTNEALQKAQCNFALLVKCCSYVKKHFAGPTVQERVRSCSRPCLLSSLSSQSTLGPCRFPSWSLRKNQTVPLHFEYQVRALCPPPWRGDAKCTVCNR